MEQNNLPKHLLVLRVSAMGDVAMLPHAIRALRKAYPDLKITVATRKLFEPFFEGLDVDFMFLNTNEEHSSIKGLLQFARLVKKRGIDAVADAHFVLRTITVTLFLRLLGLRSAHIRKGRIEKWFRLGYSQNDAVPLKHTVIRYCDVFRRLGFVFDDPEPIEVGREYANPMGEKKGRWVGFAPFSAHEGKTYPQELRSEVVALLAKRYERVFIHSGGGSEQRFAEDMEAAYPNVTAVFGKLNLEGEIALIANLDCVVSMDSLVMHLCSLTATPVVSVWGATHPELGFLGYGCDAEGVLQKEMECRPCSIYGNKPCKWGDVRCIRAITPQMIADRVEYLIGKHSKDGA
ncbi:MAG: glycosyltransferase family 9 protein [Alistipes sp.]